MTRYSNPPPHAQTPRTQGRPAGAAPQAPQAPYYEQPGWPSQPQQAAPPPRNGGRFAGPGFADPGGYGSDPQTGGRPAGGAPQNHDPYAALRPDGYGYGQPSQPAAADPYGLAGYTAPQPAPGYGSRAPQMPSPPQPSYGTGAADPYAAGNGYGQPSAPAAPSPYGSPQAHGYEPSFGGPSPSAQPSPQLSYGAEYGAPQAAPADQWGSPSLGGFEAHDYGTGYASQDQWGADPYGEPQLEPALGPAGGYPNAPPPQHGAFDQSYAEDEAQYEDEPRRGGWKKVVGLVACTVLLGGAGTVAYNSILGPDGSSSTPLVKSASGPSKVKPSEPGGKQFAHTDSKIMGRLGESSSDSSSDPAGVRRVPVVTVGRDGSIQPPASAEPEETRAVVAVPGLTVIDGLGGPSPTRPAGPGAASPPVQMAATEGAGPVVVAPPARKTAETKPAETGAVQTKEIAPAPKADPPKKKVAAATPAATGPKPTGAGYVAVLASVPASSSSRIDALKQFADMQQKYGMILQNKTPDVQEANLGEKGTYHRLLVGPPGSRDSASSVCTQLKAEGYSGCWVTAY